MSLLSRFLPFFSDLDPDRPTRSAQRGAIFWVRNSVRPTHSAQSHSQTWDADRRVHFQLRIPYSLVTCVLFYLFDTHSELLADITRKAWHSTIRVGTGYASMHTRNILCPRVAQPQLFAGVLAVCPPTRYSLGTQPNLKGCQRGPANLDPRRKKDASRSAPSMRSPRRSGWTEDSARVGRVTGARGLPGPRARASSGAWSACDTQSCSEWAPVLNGAREQARKWGEGGRGPPSATSATKLAVGV